MCDRCRGLVACGLHFCDGEPATTPTARLPHDEQKSDADRPTPDDARSSKDAVNAPEPQTAR